jgi:hypothetical protein
LSSSLPRRRLWFHHHGNLPLAAALQHVWIRLPMMSMMVAQTHLSRRIHRVDASSCTTSMGSW